MSVLGAAGEALAVFGGLLVVILVLAFNIARRRRAEVALRQSQESLSITLNSIADAVIAADTEGRVTWMNPVAVKLTGWSADRARQRAMTEVFRVFDSEMRKSPRNPVEEVIRADGAARPSRHGILLASDGSERLIAQSGAPIRDRSGGILGVVLVFRDVTEENAIQEQLRQSQKMEAIGQLAGGIAHDFNNLLTGIMGNAELLRAKLPQPDETRGLAEQIVGASARAAELTKQLLAFSREGKLQDVAVDVHELIAGVVGLLSHSIDRRIEIVQRLEASPCKVQGDPTQLKNALLNLGVNARDAMPEGGALTFATRNAQLDEDRCRSASQEIRPGPYLEISVSDTGVGMTSEVQRRIFEPFFTTKVSGEGTGLGLAGVYGCVESHRGMIQVESEVGMGASFTIALPLVQEAAAPASDAADWEMIRGHGVILIVDDEEIVRNYSAKVLRDLGYRVVSCADGVEALDFFRHKHSEVDLVLLDLLMPKLGGEETFRLMKEVDPELRVLVTSGFSYSRAVTALLRAGALNVLNKPFRVDELSREVARHVRSQV